MSYEHVVCVVECKKALKVKRAENAPERLFESSLVSCPAHPNLLLCE